MVISKGYPGYIDLKIYEHKMKTLQLAEDIVEADLTKMDNKVPGQKWQF
jgi:hypothetical protein